MALGHTDVIRSRIEKQNKREAEENERIEMQVQKRIKEKREAVRQDPNPNIQLEKMG